MAALRGQRIVVTRAVHQSEELAQPLRQLGGNVIALPLLTIAPPADPEPLQSAAANLASFDLIIFTSANAVRAFTAAIPLGSDLSRVQVAAVGPATRQAALGAGFHVSIVPPVYQAEALVEALSGALGTEFAIRVLIPGSDLSRDTVPNELRRRGAQVTAVEAYRNVCPPGSAHHAHEIFREPYPDWVLFASPSAFHNLVSLVGTEAIAACRIASIGAVTSEAIRSAGLTVTVQADPQTTAGLVKAVAGFPERPPDASAR